jgi:5-methylcytosine-specific restriction enzyme A
MPLAPPRPCAQPRCPHLQPCPVHPKAAWRTTGAPPPARIRGRKLQRLRAELFTKQPLCVVCLSTGRITIATIRDHVVPLTEGGPDDRTNEQPICADCHRAKTEVEAKRGIRGHRGVS